ELIGLSIDIFGQWQNNAATKAKDVTNVVFLNSCDVVTRPSAGGAFRRTLHSEEGDPPVDPTTLPTADSTPAPVASTMPTTAPNQEQIAEQISAPTPPV